MSRFNFLNPQAQQVLEAGRRDDDMATVTRAVRASGRDRKSRRTESDDGITVLGTTPDGHELRANASKQGIEIRFVHRPADAVLDELKAGGWKWSRFSGVWYARDTAAARDWAKTFIANLVTGAPAATPPNPPAAPTTFPPAVAETPVPTPVAPAPVTPPRLVETTAVVILDNPPPGGWTEADRVPDQYRRQPTPQIAPMKGFSPLGLPQRPKPFAKAA